MAIEDVLMPVPKRPNEIWPWQPIPKDRKVAQNDLPKITLVTPSYNQAKFIEETLRSVVLQGYPNLEWLVFDGGSHDGAVDYIKRYAAWIDYWESEPDLGQSHAINKGFKRSTGDWIGWLNSDDTLLPGALNTWAQVALANPGADVLVGGVRNVTEAGKTISEFLSDSSDIGLSQLARWNAPGGTVLFQPGCLFKRATLERIGFLSESLHYALDVDLFLRLVKNGKFVTVPGLVAGNRIYGGAKTYRDVVPRILEHARVIYAHGLCEEAEDYLVFNLPELVAKLPRQSDILSRLPIGTLFKACIKKMRRRFGI